MLWLALLLEPFCVEPEMHVGAQQRAPLREARAKVLIYLSIVNVTRFPKSLGHLTLNTTNCGGG